MNEDDMIYSIEPDGFVRRNYLNHATINDVIIRYIDVPNEIRVVKPITITESQIEISCKLINELCSALWVDDDDDDDNILSYIFVVISTSNRFALKCTKTYSINSIQKNIVIDAFRNFLTKPLDTDYSIMGIDYIGNQKKYNNHQDAYNTMREYSFQLDNDLKYSRSYYGSLNDVTDAFENRSIRLFSTLTGVSISSTDNTLICDNYEEIYTIEFHKKSCASFLVYSTDKYLISNISDNNTIMSNGDMDDLGIYFKIYSIGDHFAIKSIINNKWISCIDGVLQASCDSPDIFSLFDICLVKIDEKEQTAHCTRNIRITDILDAMLTFKLYKYEYEIDLPDKTNE